MRPQRSQLPLSTKLIPISRRELIKKLTAIGFTGPYPGTKHQHMVKDGVFVMIPNPHHGEKISVKLQQIILKETGICRDEWISAT
ncbi:MAG: type II toxin-antitoxin system HicA family toxin [Methanothrix sp.]